MDIDYLFLDNTFADPEYDFPSREEAYKGLVKIVKEHKDYRVYMFTYYLGKEEVLINLAKELESLVNLFIISQYFRLSLMKIGLKKLNL